MDWLRWQTAVDLLVLATAVYYLLLWTRRTRALRIALGILALQAGSLVAVRFDLTVTRWVLQAASVMAVFALLVLFQPELRRAILRLEQLLHLRREPADSSAAAARDVAEVVFLMAKKRVGALIVIVNRDAVADLVDGGVALGAEVHAEIIEAIFHKESPLHDGALVIDGDRIARAGVVLPLTLRQDMPGEYGTRHRAAVGMAERCDALVIVVSEERGAVTLMHGRERTVLPDPQSLMDVLRGQRAKHPYSGRNALKRIALTNLGLKLAAAAVACLLWAASSLGSGSVVRVVSVPIEFGNVPGGMEIARQATTHLEVQLRGSRLLMDSVASRSGTARFDLRGAREGALNVRSSEVDLDLPPGVLVERVRPSDVALFLVRRAH